MVSIHLHHKHRQGCRSPSYYNARPAQQESEHLSKNSEPITKPDCDIESVRCCDVEGSRSDIFRAEVQNNLTGTLMASQSDCSTSVSEHVCTNLAHSLLSCSLELCV